MSINDKIQDIFRVSAQVAEVQQQLIELRREIAALQQHGTALMELLNAMRTDASRQHQSYRNALLALRYHASRCPQEPTPPSTAEIGEALPISEQFSRLQQLAPQAYAIWRPLLDVNEKAYEGSPLDSCSVSGHPMATMFRFFLHPYLKERVLDIGCGPQAVPAYLEDYPEKAIYGIDPLSRPDDHPFHFIKGIAEYLPWADAQFKLVVAATSLDHVLLLDKVFQEVCRVLCKGGIFAVWAGFVPNAKPYDPYRADIEKVDSYHLFHFDRDTFRSAIEPYFTPLEEFPIDAESSFFALSPRGGR